MNIKLQLCKLRLVTILWITDWFPSFKEKIYLKRKCIPKRKNKWKIFNTNKKWKFLCRNFFLSFPFFLSLYIFFEITIQERKNFCLLLVYHFSRTKKYYYDFEALFFVFFLFFCLKIKVGFLFVFFFFWFYNIFAFFSAFSPFGPYYRLLWWFEYWKGRKYNFFFFHFDHLRWWWF